MAVAGIYVAQKRMLFICKINKMNSTLIVTIGIIFLMVLLAWACIAVASNREKKKRMVLTGKLEELAKSHNSIIGQIDFMGKKVIVQDVKKEKVFYINCTANAPREEVIDIADVAGCSIVHIGSKYIESLKNGKEKIQEHIDKIELELNMKAGYKRHLLFYEEIGDGVMEMLPLTRKAEKWKAVFNN